MMKKLFSLLAVLIISVLMSSMAFAATIVEFVKVNGDEVTESSTNFILDVDRGDELDVKVRLKSDADLNDVQIEAVLRGIDSRETVDDITDTFDMKANVSYTHTLSLPLIDRINQDKYKMRIRISDRDSATVEKTYELDIGTERHDIEVKDVVLSPSTEVKAGRALLVTVRVRNRGEKDEDGVKVVVSIPDLGVSAADFIDELEAEDKDDDQATTEEMFLRIPDDAKTGEYEVVVDVFFDDLDKKSSYKTSIFVLGEDKVAETPKADEKTIITVAVDKQSATKGQEVAYPLALTNAGTSDKTYIVRADGATWASFRVAPSNILVIGAGESKAFTVYASAGKDAPVGEQTFTVTISSNDKTLKQLPLSMNVQESAGGDGTSTLKRSIEVGLVVLVILLVIGLIIVGFSKLRGDKEEEGKEGKEYY